MEHFFDEQLQFFKQLDVKAKGKPLKVKKWLLSREYLQPLTEPEPEEEESSPDDEYTSGYKKKLKSAYDAARYGMKEGVLTGMFFGGCWGIFKNFGDNFPFGFDSVNGKKGTQTGKSNVRSKNPTGNSTPNSTETQNAPKNDIATDENTFTNLKNVSVVQDKYTDRNSFGAHKNQLIYTSVNSKLSARNDNTYLRAIGADLFDANNFTLQKNPEKVEIVGYAFIHETGSVSDSTSSDSNSQKNITAVNEREEKVEPDKTKPPVSDNKMSKPLKRNESNRYSLGSVAGVSSTTKSHGKNKAETNIGGRKSKGSIHLQPSTGKFEHKSRLSKMTEENKSEAPRQKKGNFKLSVNQKNKKAHTSKIDFLMPEDRFESEMLLPNAPNNWENADLDSLRHTISRSNNPNSLTATNVKRPSLKKDMVKLKQSRKNLKKGSMEFASINRKKTEAENIYPDSKKIGSILVDIDAISNGFTSPPDLIATENSSFIQYTEGQLVPWTLIKRSNEKIKREMKTLEFTGSDASRSVDLTETEDHNRYTVETSPMFNRSLVSANLEEGEKDDDSSHKDLTYDTSIESRGYLLEGSSSLPRAIGNITHDVEPQRDSIRSYNAGLETPDADTNTSHYYTYHDSERFSHDRLPQHLFNLDSTSIHEKTSLSQHENEEKTEKAANENLLKGKAKSIIFNKISDRNYSQQKKQIEETLANYTRESDKTPSIDSNSSHYKSNTVVLDGKKRCSVENTLDNKFYTEDRYTENMENQSKCKPIPNQEAVKYYMEESQEKPLSVAYPYERPQDQEKIYVSIGSQTQTHDRSHVKEDKSHSPRQLNCDMVHTLEERPPTRGYSTHDKSHGNTVTVGENTIGSPRYTKPYDNHLQSPGESRKQSAVEGNDGRSVRLPTKGLHSSVYEHESAPDRSTAAKSDYSAPAFEKSSHNYLQTKKEARADGISDNVAGGVGSVGETSQQVTIHPKKVSAVQKKSEPAEKRKSSRSLNFFSGVNENHIIVSACNCAIVLGIVCSVISTTRASLAV